MNGHGSTQSLSSIHASMGNISLATANSSMTEVPGSPTSLQLRPEHEGQTYDLL